MSCNFSGHSLHLQSISTQISCKSLGQFTQSSHSSTTPFQHEDFFAEHLTNLSDASTHSQLHLKLLALKLKSFKSHLEQRLEEFIIVPKYFQSKSPLHSE